MGLNPKQRRFVEHYLVSASATQAAIAAGYAEKSADSTGCKLLKNPEVEELINQEQEQRAKRVRVESDAVLKELAFMVFARASYFTVDEKGDVAVKPGIHPDFLAAVQSVKHRTIYDFDGKVRERSGSIVLVDRVKAMNLAMRHLGLLVDRIDVDVQHELRSIVIHETAEYEQAIAAIADRSGGSTEH